jgi:adenine-specific DNA-methyltransferase
MDIIKLSLEVSCLIRPFHLSLNKSSDLDIEIIPKLSNGVDGRWRWGKQTAIERINELGCQLVKGRNEFDVFQKDYLSKNGENKSIKPKSFWLGSEFSSEAGTLQLKSIFKHKNFETPKSVDFIQYCLQQVVNKNSITLDSFAGSGTTAHAVLKLNAQDGGNRRFILIEMEDYADTITAERIRRVMSGYGEGNKQVSGLGGSFAYYTVGEAIFNPDDTLNEAVGIDVIRNYVAYSEGIPGEDQTAQDNAYTPYLMGLNSDTAWIFYYEPNQVTCLDLDFLDSLKFGAAKPETAIIYADKCLLTKEFMTKYGVIFKKIPRDITRF